jgi:hypothetical protein
MRNARLDAGDNMPPEVRWHRTRIFAPKSSGAGTREPRQALNPPGRNLLGDGRIVETPHGTVAVAARIARIDSRTCHVSAKPFWSRFGNGAVRGNASDHNVEQQLQTIFLASASEFSDDQVHGSGRLDRRISALVVASEEQITALARIKKWC